MSKDTAEYAIAPGKSVLPGTDYVTVNLPDGRRLGWDRIEDDFDVRTVELTHEHACRMKDAGYKLTPDPLPLWHKQRKGEIPAELKVRADREKAKSKAEESAKSPKKTRTTKDPEEG